MEGGKMKILVTGAAGFIGSHLCEKLLELGGFEVIGLDNFDPFYSRSIKENNLANLREREDFQFIEFDLRNIAKSRNWINPKPDLVVHLAAKAGVQPSLENPSEYLDNNVIGTFQLLEWMKRNDIRKLVFGSSSSVYGNHPEIPFREDMNVSNPISPYAYTKASNELMTFNYHHLFGLDSINLRFFTVIGPRQRPDLAIHKFFNMIQDSIPLTLYGDGSSARDYTYVDDIICGIVSAIDLLNSSSGMYEIINLGNNRPVTLKEMVLEVERTAELPVLKKKLSAQPGDVNITYADISKARKLLGYDPKTPFEKGVKEFYRWFKEIRRSEILN
jgi:UDP-glucuronate 4-epimerase